LKDKLIDLSEDIHRISRQLHPSIIEDLGLVEALRSEINNFSRLEEIPVNFEPEPGMENLPMDIAVSLFRVTQESLRNIKKHAHAKNVTIQLVQEDGSLLLTISDDGRGFSPDIVRNLPGLGLKSMRERMRLINGSISYTSREDQGAVVKAMIDMPT
jgi:signal transduction histidine kinase